MTQSRRRQDAGGAFQAALAPLARETLGHLSWVEEPAVRSSYVTTLLVRVLFLQFLQAQLWLGGYPAYLRRRLAASSGRFYGDFFLPLCLAGLSRAPAERGQFRDALRGVPFVQDALFLPHPAETAAGLDAERLLSRGVPPGCVVPDAWFASLFDLCDCWEWRADGTGAPAPGRLTPRILAAVFEQSLARKELGAFYTADDVTAAICRGTLVPALFDRLGNGTSPALDLTRISRGAGAARYVPDTLRQAGRLPLETAVEAEARHRWTGELLARHAARDHLTIGDCVSDNLDLRRVALDWIETEPDAAAVWRFYRYALGALRVLDPTCGAGDFLLAALDLLLPLSRACLARLAEEVQKRQVPSDLREAFERELSRAGEGGGTEVFLCGRISEQTLHGMDVLPGAVEVARLRLVLRLLALQEPGTAGEWESRRAGEPESPRPVVGHAFNLGVGDVLDPPADPDEGGFDAVVGNPPYVDLRRKGGLSTGDLATRACGNLYAPVVERALGRLRPGGRLGMIVPVSAVSLGEYRPLAELLFRQDCWISTFSNRPAKLFPEVEQRLAIVITGPSPAPTVRVTAYQHWYEAERPSLFDRLHYHPATRWKPTGMPIKSGSELAERVFARLAARDGRLGDREAAAVSPRRGAVPTLPELAPQGCVWLHDGPTYWVRALPFDPNPGLPARRSDHYQRIRVASEGEARLLAAILSSPTFYFFYKQTSNCRDLGRKEWAGFPLDPLPEELRGELVRLGYELEARLRATAKQCARRYPSGVVTYHEYYPARAKDVLDRVDEVLGVHYGFDAEEREFMRTYEAKYRLGRKAGGDAD